MITLWPISANVHLAMTTVRRVVVNAASVDGVDTADIAGMTVPPARQARQAPRDRRAAR
jgi:hypothetical protein